MKKIIIYWNIVLEELAFMFSHFSKDSNKVLLLFFIKYIKHYMVFNYINNYCF